MINEIKKIGVFVKRDLRMFFTYKVAFFSNFFNMIFTFFYLVLFGTMFRSASVPDISTYGGDFISFILVGSMGWSFLWNIMNSVSFSLRNEMLMGTLESVLLTRTKIHTMMIAYAIFGSLFGLLTMAALFIVGSVFFGVTAFSSANIYTLIIFILSIFMMAGFGMIFGGLTLWFKNIGQTIPLIQGITMFFCGVYFPLAILPEYLQPIAKFIPFYWSIEGMRQSLIMDKTDVMIFDYIIILTVLAIASIAIGALALNRGFKKAKKDGSLGFY
jgi:ABC-2 type transport system permease protein